MAVYTVDFGHTLSGGDTGARGNGLVEENLTREIGNLVVEGLIRRGHTVHVIQLDYANSMVESLNYRVDKIISINPDQSISIHINAFINSEANGVEVWGDNLCKDMCIRIANNISKEFNLTNRGFKNGVEDLALVGLYGQSNVPALLIECFFITNQSDASKYNAEKYANCIIAGILNKPIIEVQNAPQNEMEVKKKVKGIVIYGNDIDRRAAEYLADGLGLPTINAATNFDYSTVEQSGIYAVGGSKGTYTSYLLDENFISGSDRFDTVKKVLSKLGKL